MSTLRTIVFFALLYALLLLEPGNEDEEETTSAAFQIEKPLPPGQGFVIAVNTPELGDWDISQAPLMTVITSPNSWAATVDLVAGTTVEYKPVRIMVDTREVLEWLPGNSLVLDVPSEGPNYTVVTFPGP